MKNVLYIALTQYTEVPIYSPLRLSQHVGRNIIQDIFAEGRTYIELTHP